MEDTSENKSGKKQPKRVSAALLAHVDAGKTTLSEALLYTSGNLRKMGRVDKQDAFLDTYALERERGITIFSKQAMLRSEEMEITLLDTPGHVDFSAEMERTLQVLDYAILIISGMDGIQGHTRTLWQLLERYDIPVFLFINKMDQPGTDRQALLQELKDNLSGYCTDFGADAEEGLYEAAALCEEGLLEEFLETGELSQEEIVRLIWERKLFPCYFGSALKLDGVEEFFRGLGRYTISPDYGTEFGARVYKILRDPQGNRLTCMKVTGGRLRVKEEVMIPGGDGGEEFRREKVDQIRIYSGEKYELTDVAEAGTICTVAGLTGTVPGQGLGVEKDTVVPVLEPVLTYQIIPPPDQEPAVLLPKLRMLEEEEPQLHVVWDESLQEIQAQVMGEVQLEILQSMIWDRFDVRVSFGPGNIVYKETVTSVTEGVGHFEPLRHYAEVHLLLEPGEPGSGMQYLLDCSEEILDRNWQRLILTHLEEKEHVGVLTGSPLTDMKITVVSGKAHLKHTEGGDFRQATYRAVRQGLMQAQSVLLEPYYQFRLELPTENVGKAMSDLDQMGAEFSLPDTVGEITVLTGSAPVASMRDYQREVTGYTRGNGRLSCVWKGYGPCHNTEEVMEQKGYDPLLDSENPSSSVFCSHGSGVYVEWDQVPEYMHMESALKERQKRAEENDPEETRWQEYGQAPDTGTPREEAWLGVEEVDAILDRAHHANRKESFVPHKGISHKRRKASPSVTREYGSGKKPAYVPKEQYLLVDGYNIIFAWEELKKLAEDNIDSARGRLLDILCDYQGVKQCHLIAVFDAYRVQGHPTEILDYHNIHVVFTKEAETADQYIEKFAHENARKYDVTVATSDGLEQIIITGEGCRLLSARELEKEVQDQRKNLQEEYMDQQTKRGDSLLEHLSEKSRKEIGME